MPHTEDEVVESDKVFTLPVRQLLGKAPKSFLRWRHAPKLTYAVLVGREVSSDTQTLDSIVSTTGRVQVDDYVKATVGNDLTSWANLGIGQTTFIASANTAGNAVITSPDVAPAFGESLYEVLAVYVTLEADANAASRIINVDFVSGMTPETGTPFAQSINVRVVGPTLTASQEGSVHIGSNNVVGINTNGTMTQGTTSPCPFLLGDAGVLRSTITAGLAGDFHRLSAIVRRIA